MLYTDLCKVTREYQTEKKGELTNSKLSTFLRKDIVIEAKNVISIEYPQIIVKASVGQGAWAEIPWLCFFDPYITTKASQGYYVGYLIDSLKNNFTLFLGYSSDEEFQRYPQKTALEVLRKKSELLSYKLSSYKHIFTRNTLTLSGNSKNSRGYEAGFVIGKTYSTSEHISEEQFTKELLLLLHAYSEIIKTDILHDAELELLPGDFNPIEEASDTEINETRNKVTSVRYERNPTIRKKVLKSKGAVCEACGLNPEKQYGYKGPKENTPLDVHHKHKFSEIEKTRKSAIEDFLVLCPTCHRMIHKQNDISNLEELKQKINFNFS